VTVTIISGTETKNISCGSVKFVNNLPTTNTTTKPKTPITQESKPEEKIKEKPIEPLSVSCYPNKYSAYAGEEVDWTANTK
jgi:hypothetical protein